MLKFLEKNLYLTNTPYIYIFKQRIFSLKSNYVGKKKNIYYLISQRKNIKLYSKYFNLNKNISSEFISEKKTLYNVFFLTMFTGLKIKNEVKIKQFNNVLTEVEKVYLVNYNSAILYNKNLNFNTFRNKYKYKLKKNVKFKYKNLLDCKRINDFRFINTVNKKFLYLNKNNINKFNIFYNLLPSYKKWFYIYNIYMPTVNFKYLHSYNYLTLLKYTKFNWFFQNLKSKKYKYNLLFYKIKNKNLYYFFYEYIFFYNIFLRTNILKKNFINNFNFFYNSVEYFYCVNIFNLNDDILFNNKFKNFYYFFNKNLFFNNINKTFNSNIKFKLQTKLFRYNLINLKLYKYNNLIKLLYLYNFKLISKLKKINNIINLKKKNNNNTYIKNFKYK